MKRSLLTIAFGILMFNTFGQNNWCGTDRILQNLKNSNPGFSEHMHHAMSRASHGNGVSNKSTLIVPVVVHIIHDNGIGNISDQQVQNALDVLNADYNRQNTDTANTRNTSTAPFKPNAGPMDIVFKLAKIDPNGNCTNGIVRVNAPSLTYDANDDCKYSSNGGSDQWPMDSYLNLWVVNSIESDGAGITLGYAYLPYWPSGTNYGILIRNDAFGKIETALGSDGRTLTHEMGHLLGLSHIFDAGWNGDTGCHTDDCNNAGDYCCDTPPQAEANWSCSSTWNSCSDIPTNDDYGFDAVDQIENYMSYNACQNMFSKDQAAIMQYNFVDISFLESVASAANQIATGVNDPETFCKAEFEASKTGVCTSDTIAFTDRSFHNPNGWTWSVSPGVENTDWEFTSGTTSSSQHTVIRFMTSGTYSIQLSATDGVTNDTEIKSSLITVFPEATSLPFLEGFETFSNFSQTDQWAVYNPDGNNAFVVDLTTGSSGTHSARLTNFGQGGPNSDELIASAVDLSAVNPATEIITMSFRYAYRKRLASNDEWLKVFITKDCGDTWVQRKTMHGSQLSTLISTSSWTPTSPSDWVTVHMTNITSEYWVPNFRYKFEFEGNGGNNFFLDDINIYKGAPSNTVVAGINDESLVNEFSLFPNPTEGELNLNFNVNSAVQMNLQIVDLTGQTLMETVIKANSGANLVVLDTQKLSSGTYFVKLNSNNSNQTLPFVVK